MTQEAIRRAGAERPDLVIVVKGACLGVEGVRILRRATGVPVVNIYPDSPYERWALRSDMPTVLAEYDRTYIWGRRLASRLRQDGVRSVVYLPFAHDPADYAPHLDAPTAECHKRHAVVFVGQYQPKRDEWLVAFAGCDLGVWGGGWSRSRLARIPGICIHRQRIHGAAVGAVYAGAKVAINILNPQNESAHNMRTFEIPPCRTVMVTEASAEIAEFFSPEAACLDADTPADLRGQAERALDDRLLAARLAESAREAGRAHTYSARVETLLRDLDSQLSLRSGSWKVV